jgi:hypothetical protein
MTQRIRITKDDWREAIARALDDLVELGSSINDLPDDELLAMAREATDRLRSALNMPQGQGAAAPGPTQKRARVQWPLDFSDHVRRKNEWRRR